MAPEGVCSACDAAVAADPSLRWAACCLWTLAGYPPPVARALVCASTLLRALSLLPAGIFLLATLCMVAKSIARASHRGDGAWSGCKLTARRQKRGLVRNVVLTADLAVTVFSLALSAVVITDAQAFAVLCLGHAAAAGLWALACRQDWRVTALLGGIAAVGTPLTLLELQRCQRVESSLGLLASAAVKIWLHGGARESLKAAMLLWDAAAVYSTTANWLIGLRLYLRVRQRI